MRIETNDIDNDIKFSEIEKGEVFKYYGLYFLKTDPIYLPNSDCYANAVRLEDGDAGHCFEDWNIVEKVNAKVVVEE